MKPTKLIYHRNAKRTNTVCSEVTHPDGRVEYELSSINLRRHEDQDAEHVPVFMRKQAD